MDPEGLITLKIFAFFSRFFNSCVISFSILRSASTKSSSRASVLESFSS